MAITKEQQPAKISLSNAPLIFVTSSTSAGQTRFRYLYDIKMDIDGVRTRVARIRQVKNPNDYGIIDVSRIAESYLTPTYVASQDDTVPIHFINGSRSAAASKNSGTCKIVEVEYGESYASGSVDPDDYANLTNHEIYCLYGSAQFEDGRDWPFDDYVMNDSSAKFLTDMPRTRTLHADTSQAQYGDWMTLGFLNPSTTGAVGSAAYLRVKGFSGGVLNNNTNESVFALSVAEDQFMQFVGVGPMNLEENGTLDFTDTDYYTVNLENASGNPVSETFTFYVKDKTCKYPIYQIAFLNRYGAWDYMTFEKRSSRRVNVDRQQYTKNFGTWTTPNGSWSYNGWEGGKRNFNVKAQEILTLNSNWISEAEAVWLEQLITTPEAYIIDLDLDGTVDASSVRPIIIRTSNYEIKTSVNDKVFNLEIEVEYAHERRV